MSTSSNDSLYGQAVENGGIVGMFMEDFKPRNRISKQRHSLRTKIITHLNEDIHESQIGIRRDKELIKSLKSMRP